MFVFNLLAVFSIYLEYAVAIHRLALVLVSLALFLRGMFDLGRSPARSQVSFPVTHTAKVLREICDRDITLPPLYMTPLRETMYAVPRARRLLFSALKNLLRSLGMLFTILQREATW